MNFEGQNINLKDALFVDNITGDIENFREGRTFRRIIVLHNGLLGIYFDFVNLDPHKYEDLY